MKKISLIIFYFAFVCFSYHAKAQRGSRVGYIDMEYILTKIPEYQEATTQLEGKVQKWKKELEKKQKQIDQLKLDLSSEKVLLTIELIAEREEEILLLEEELFNYQQERFGPNGSFDTQRRGLVRPIQDQVFNIIQEIGDAKKYDIILDKSSADLSVLYAAKRNDISETVLRRINRAAVRKEAKNKRDKKEIEERDNLTDEQDELLSDREKAAQDKKNERERLFEERKKQRDSIREAKKVEFEERRKKILEERKRRKDSIEAIKNKGGTPSGPPSVGRTSNDK